MNNNPSQPQGFFFNQQQGYNLDGTLKNNPVINTGQTFTDSNNIIYQLKALKSQDSISFNNQSYKVYLAIPERMIIDVAYKNPNSYFPTNTAGLELPAEIQKLRSKKPGELENRALFSPPPTVIEASTDKGPDRLPAYSIATNGFIPNLPNSSLTSHNGATANVYWTLDPYLGADFIGNAYHMIGYGWAADAKNVNKSPPFYLLKPNTGDDIRVETLVQSQPPFNYWHNLIVRNKYHIYTADNKKQIENWTDLVSHIRLLVCQSSTIAIANCNQYKDYPFNTDWLIDGIFRRLQPYSGFQANLGRYGTASGSSSVFNQTFGLYVKSPDGTVLLPASKDCKGSYQQCGIPLVRQTWTGDQRFTLLNLTRQVIPSTQDQYPGNEVYFAANAYLPSQAGVITHYNNFSFYDTNSYARKQKGQGLTLSYRAPDIWLGAKGDTPTQAMQWSYKCLNWSGNVNTSNCTEPSDPGGQLWKPYMLGGNMTPDVNDPAKPNYSFRFEHSNSFLVNQITRRQFNNKLYQASYYVDLEDGKGYQKLATFGYQWKKWQIGAKGKWQLSTNKTSKGKALGSAVPAFTLTSTGLNLLKQFPSYIKLKPLKTHNPDNSLTWNNTSDFSVGAGGCTLNPSTQGAECLNKPGNTVYGYKIQLDTTKNVKFLMVLTSGQTNQLPDPNLTLSQNQDGTAVTAAWQGTDQEQYQLWISTKADHSDKQIIPAASGTENSYIYNGTKPGKTYYFQVIGTQGKQRVSSQWQSIRPSDKILPEPEIINVISTTDSATVKWYVPNADQYDYRLCYGQSQDPQQVQCNPIKSTDNPAILSGLKPDTSYWVGLATVDQSNAKHTSQMVWQPFSTESITPTPPAKPVNLVASNITSSGFTLSWQEPGATNDYRYKIYYHEINKTSGHQVTKPVDSPPATISGLQPDTQYYVQVAVWSIKDLNTISDSRGISVTTKASSNNTSPYYKIEFPPGINVSEDNPVKFGNQSVSAYDSTITLTDHKSITVSHNQRSCQFIFSQGKAVYQTKPGTPGYDPYCVELWTPPQGGRKGTETNPYLIQIGGDW
jgi:hypothetical protein